MNVHLLINALGGIDDDLIRAADEEIPRQRKRPIAWRKIAALAACLTLLTALTAALMLLPGNRSHTPSVSGDETTAPTVTTDSGFISPPSHYGDWYDANEPYVIVTILDITEEAKRLSTYATDDNHEDHYRVECKVLYVNTTYGLTDGPYYDNSHTPLISVKEIVDIWFPSIFMPLLNEEETVLFKLANTSVNSIYYYVPDHHLRIDGKNVAIIPYKDGKLILNDELNCFPFESIMELNDRAELFNEYYPDIDYDTIKIQDGSTVEETISYFSYWKQIMEDV